MIRISLLKNISDSIQMRFNKQKLSRERLVFSPEYYQPTQDLKTNLRHYEAANKAIKDKYAPYVKQGNYRSEIAVELELASLSFDFRANHCSPRDLRKLALLEEKLGSRQKAREYQEMAQERDCENNPPESGRGMLAYEINSNFMAYIRREVNVYGYDEDQLDRETMGNITWEQIYDLYQKSEKTSKHYSGFEGGVKAVAIWKDLVNEIKTRSASGNKLEQQLKKIPPRQALKR